MAALETKHAVEKARQQVWVEHIRKELQTQKITTEFHVNPFTLKLISDKPNQIDPTAIASVEKEEGNALEDDLINTLERSALPPRERFVYPLSTSHEIGWFLKDVAHRPRAHYEKPRVQSDITRYANAIIAQGNSPFPKKANSKESGKQPK